MIQYIKGKTCYQLRFKVKVHASNPHSKKYHKYITNIPQIYHKSTTKCDIVSQKCVIVPQKCDIVPQKALFTTKCNILPHSVVFFINNPTTNCTILLQNIIFYYKL